MNSREYIIFGAGKTGERVVYQHYKDINISCFWDNTKTGELLGYPIEKPEVGRNAYIIVATMAYLGIREQLLQMGYCEFEDFIPYQIFGRKIAIAYGNCHLEAIKKYLERHRGFDSTYGFYPFPMIQIWKNSKENLMDVLRRCALFIHQSIRKDNGYGEKYASEYLLQHIPKTCEVIAVPNLYGLPKYLFPQLDYVKLTLHGNWYPFFVDGNMVEWIKEGKNLYDIKNYIIGGGGISKRCYCRNVESICE